MLFSCELSRHLGGVCAHIPVTCCSGQPVPFPNSSFYPRPLTPARANVSDDHFPSRGLLLRWWCPDRTMAWREYVGGQWIYWPRKLSLTMTLWRSPKGFAVYMSHRATLSLTVKKDDGINLQSAPMMQSDLSFINHLLSKLSLQVLSS